MYKLLIVYPRGHQNYIWPSYVMKDNYNVNKFNRFLPKIMYRTKSKPSFTFSFSANSSDFVLFEGINIAVFLYYKDCFLSFDWRICFKIISVYRNRAGTRSFLTFTLISLQVIELKQEMWAEWPFTYYPLTDKPNSEKLNWSPWSDLTADHIQN